MFFYLTTSPINRNRAERSLSQDGRVEGRALTSSCESTRITTSCWTIIDRKTGTHQKRYSTSKEKGEAAMRQEWGRNHNKIKSHNCWVGDSQTGEQLYHRSPPTGVKVLSPMSGFLTWGSVNGRRNCQRIRFWRVAGFDSRTSTGLWETETPLLKGTQSSVCIGTQGKEQWPQGRLNQTYLLVLEGLLQRWEEAVAHRGDNDTGSRNSGKHYLVWALPESTISPTKGPVGSSVGSPHAKQPTERELSPMHQQTSGLKFNWALPTRATSSSTYHQSLPSGSLHNPLR